MTTPKKDRVSPSVGDRVISGLNDFKTALESGHPIERKFTLRTVELDLEPQLWSSVRIVEIREQLSVSQAVFAELVGVSAHAVRAWEQGHREPTKMARRLLDEMFANPARWKKLLEKAVIRKDNRRTTSPA